LNERTSNRNHCFLDTLLLDDLPIERLDPISLSIASYRAIQIVNCDGDMVQIEEFHLRTR
jgi:hypothetical protein